MFGRKLKMKYTVLVALFKEKLSPCMISIFDTFRVTWE